MNKRNLAIDMFRGLTMTLMVFVNEFWKVFNVPHWMEHYATLEDGMGLSDIVFPLFLFAMGMSIPYALERRIAKGYSTESTVLHIVSRTFTLLVMGAFICNQESREMAGNRALWTFLMVVGFFLTWNQYPKDWCLAAGARPCLPDTGRGPFRRPLVGYPGTDWLDVPFLRHGIPALPGA